MLKGGFSVTHIELHPNHIMSIHFPFQALSLFSPHTAPPSPLLTLNLTTVMNSALAIKTKGYYAAQSWPLLAALAPIPSVQ